MTPLSCVHGFPRNSCYLVPTICMVAAYFFTTLCMQVESPRNEPSRPVRHVASHGTAVASISPFRCPEKRPPADAPPPFAIPRTPPPPNKTKAHGPGAARGGRGRLLRPGVHQPDPAPHPRLRAGGVGAGRLPPAGFRAPRRVRPRGHRGRAQVPPGRFRGKVFTY